MTITSSRKPDKLGGRLSSEVEHWGSSPKVRGSIPRSAEFMRVQRMIDIIGLLTVADVCLSSYAGVRAKPYITLYKSQRNKNVLFKGK